MILNVSSRTDIVAFYSDWFINRYKIGFIDVRNPYYKKLVSRINFKDVDLIVYCTKNPLNIDKIISSVPIPFYIHITLTPYNKDIEVNVIDKKKIIENIKFLSKKYGKNKIVIRYDPIFLNEKYNISYHLKAFNKLINELDGYIEKILISFIDIYKNTKNNMNTLKVKEFNESDYEIIGTSFSKIAHNHNIKIFTCFEKEDLTRFGFDKDSCISKEKYNELTNKEFNKLWRARKEKLCSCLEMVDIGEYNTCPHLCKYCYANYDEKNVLNNYKNHDDDSSLLIRYLESDDIIKARQ